MLVQCALLVVLTTVSVAGRRCYLGQQSGADTSELLWSVADAKPSECSNFELGGLNARPQQILDKVTVGSHPDLTSLQQDEPEPTRFSDGACVVLPDSDAFPPRYPSAGHLSSQLTRLELNNHDVEFEVRMYTVAGLSFTVTFDYDGVQISKSAGGPPTNIHNGAEQNSRVWVDIDAPNGDVIVGTGDANTNKTIGTASLDLPDMAIYAVEFGFSGTAVPTVPEWRIYAPCE